MAQRAEDQKDLQTLRGPTVRIGRPLEVEDNMKRSDTNRELHHQYQTSKKLAFLPLTETSVFSDDP